MRPQTLSEAAMVHLVPKEDFVQLYKRSLEDRMPLPSISRHVFGTSPLGKHQEYAYLGVIAATEYAYTNGIYLYLEGFNSHSFHLYSFEADRHHNQNENLFPEVGDIALLLPHEGLIETYTNVMDDSSTGRNSMASWLKEREIAAHLDMLDDKAQLCFYRLMARRDAL
ncbi:MAG: hypothetical protein KJ709_04485 [Nanoarchaeota archaeon]|nr:hypothetical protein [Nanoarchaeota archaeon]